MTQLLTTREASDVLHIPIGTLRSWRFLGNTTFRYQHPGLEAIRDIINRKNAEQGTGAVN